MPDKNENPVVIDWEFTAKLNFACHQNSFPALRSLRIKNTNPEESLSNLQVSISANPEFMKTKTWIIDQISPNSFVSVPDRDIELNGEFLLQRRESVGSSVTITVKRDGAVLAESTRSIDVLAYNEWGGVDSMPHLLAAFSLPNDPAIGRILHSTSQMLRDAGRSAGIDGYKSGSRRRVWELAAGIYRAIVNLGITYAVPPASFERTGQKIRLPWEIERNKVATCLDTTMLFVAAFEQARLNPIIALPRSHAMAGVWLQPNEHLSTAVIDDAETLRKACQLNELILIETTLVTTDRAPSVTQAIERAMDRLASQHDSTFSAAIDIRLARAKIKPLGLETPSDGLVPVDDDENDFKPLIDEPPPLPDFDTEPEPEPPTTPEGRFEKWQRKLLNLTAINPLLNYRSTKASLTLWCPEPQILVDRLAEGKTMSIQAAPEQDQDEEIHRERTGRIIGEDFARDALQKNQVLIKLPGDEIQNKAVEIFRRMRFAREESGSNTLYLVFGFLHWKRSSDDRKFQAPLILVPVTLRRASVQSRFRIIAHDDETRFNTTLLEMLRRQFSIDIRGLDGQLTDADTDGAAVDIASILTVVQRSVKEVPGFEVEDKVVLGHFSFAKYLMWKDLVDRKDAIREHPLVKHLVETPGSAYHDGISFVQPKDLDQALSPTDLFTPLPADASQMSAVASAQRGKSFIIIGPPGTGKSQTISNMIAHLLGSGKTVLFVSEKIAALDVVHRRLREIGLGRFCMELHSNKANKADVLKQLRTAWEASGQQTEAEWRRTGEKLKKYRDRLNSVVDYLHTPRRNGLTPHRGIGIRVRDEELAKRVQFTWAVADRHNEDDMVRMRDVSEQLRLHAETVSRIGGSPLRVVAASTWSPQWQAELVDRAAALASAARDADKAVTWLLNDLGLDLPDRTLTRLNALTDLAVALRESYETPIAFALEQGGDNRIDALYDLAKLLPRHADARLRLSMSYPRDVWRNIDGNDIVRRWALAKSTWWPMTLFSKLAVISALRTAGSGHFLEIPNPGQDGPALADLRSTGEAIDRLEGLLGSLIPWPPDGTDPDSLREMAELGRRLRKVVGALMNDPRARAEARAKIRNFLLEEHDLLGPEGTVRRAVDCTVSARDAMTAAARDFKESAGRDIRKEFARTDLALEMIRDTADFIVEQKQHLAAWCGWRKCQAKAIDMDLKPLVDGIEHGSVPIDEIAETFDASYAAWWTDRLFGEDTTLRDWFTAGHVNDIEKFRKMDDDFMKATVKYVEAVLCGRIPRKDAIGRNAQWSRVHQLTGQIRPRIPIRKLLTDAEEPIARLTPCLMMSPLSVAQYLPAKHARFDVVIIDEASQMTVWDAIGAIARGQQTIVAGDRKQLPPTIFFQRSDDDDDSGIDYGGDSESILDELGSAGIPELMLNLHYRSRHEGLIAFSNRHYYEDRLVTFPAPVRKDYGVRLVRPDGHYERGTARRNVGEAKAIVDDIVRRLTATTAAVREQSIGVVTFNSEQQSLILDLLDKKRAEMPGIEWAFKGSISEPVFVKNLETVQGDERDVILFSVTYGPDRFDHMTMNFGPLNRKGGERRLNVAMTRARHEMVVFSTLKPERIDETRAGAQAVRDLKEFLRYAEHGPSELDSKVHGPVGDFESPFEVAVARALRRRWNLQPQVGVSAYRIDIGIVHPDRPGDYLAGVECDGAMYHSSAYARERDKIRQEQLEKLGWKLFRVWSADWWLNKDQALATLEEQLNEHLEADRKTRAEAQAVKNRIDSEPTDSEESENDDRKAETSTTTDEDTQFISPSGTNASSEEDYPLFAFDRKKDVPSEEQYVKARLDASKLVPSRELFFKKDYNRRLNDMLNHVIDTEGPVHLDVLVCRIADHHRLQPSDPKVRERVEKAARIRRGSTREDVGWFFWRKGTVKNRASPARYAGRDDDMRNVDYICAEEVRSIARKLDIDEVTDVANALGIERLEPSARTRLEIILWSTD